MKKLINILESLEIKPTYERLRIYKYLKEDNKMHPTVNTIYNGVLKDIPTISKTTVYNTLNLFIEKGIIIPIFITGKEERFDIITIPHHHFLCEKCNKIIDIIIKCPYFQKGSVQGHKINEFHAYFKGICKDCLNSENNSDK